MDGVRWRLQIVTLEVILDDTTFRRENALLPLPFLFPSPPDGKSRVVGWAHACYAFSTGMHARLLQLRIRTSCSSAGKTYESKQWSCGCATFDSRPSTRSRADERGAGNILHSRFRPWIPAFNHLEFMRRRSLRKFLASIVKSNGQSGRDFIVREELRVLKDK